MKFFRFSIARMLIGTALVSVLIAAETTGNPVLLLIASNLALVVLLGSILGAICHSRPEQRAFCLGFALFGWGALLMHNPLFSSYLYIVSPLTAMPELENHVYTVVVVDVLLFGLVGGCLALLFSKPDAPAQ